MKSEIEGEFVSRQSRREENLNPRHTLKAQESDFQRNRSAADNAVCPSAVESVFPSGFSAHKRRMTDNAGHRESKKSIYGFQSPVARTPPLPSCPRFHSLPLPDRFSAGTFIDSGKGAVIQQSMSVSAQRREGWRRTESGRH